MNQNTTLSIHQYIRPLVLITLVLTVLTIILSAYIRLSVSGVGCENWPECYGYIGHTTPQQGIDVLTSQGQSMQHKGIRKLHRVVASMLGITILMIVAMTWRGRQQPGTPGMTAPVLLLLMTLFLSILGYSTPSPDLPLVTFSNLFGGMIMLALVWWIWRDTEQQQHLPTASHSRSTLVVLLIVLMQIALGAWTSSNLAASACSEIVACPGINWSVEALFSSFNPVTQLEVNSLGMVIADNSARIIHLLHKVFALITLIAVFYLAYRLYPHGGRAATISQVMGGLIILQVFLGIIGIINHLPVWLATLHNTVAALLLLAITDIYHLFRQRQKQ